jgi:hypothetical protein
MTPAMKNVVEASEIKASEIKSRSEAKQIDSVSAYPALIEKIFNPSEAVQLAAVKRDGYSIQYIKNPSEAVQLACQKSFRRITISCCETKCGVRHTYQEPISHGSVSCYKTK